MSERKTKYKIRKIEQLYWNCPHCPKIITGITENEMDYNVQAHKQKHERDKIKNQ